MNTKQKDAQWWREYYDSHKEKLREYNRERMRKKRGTKKVKPVKTITETMIGETITKGSVKAFIEQGLKDGSLIDPIAEAEKQAKLAELRKLMDKPLGAVEAGFGLNLGEPKGIFNLGKPCQICRSKITTEVFYEDPDWSGNVWLCEKHRLEKGL